VHLGGAQRAVERLDALTEIVDGELIRLRHASALAVLGEADPTEVLRDLDQRGLVFEAVGLRAALDG
jgi:hypothetical protein